jgi:hypothetical protein
MVMVNSLKKLGKCVAVATVCLLLVAGCLAVAGATCGMTVMALGTVPAVLIGKAIVCQVIEQELWA